MRTLLQKKSSNKKYLEALQREESKERLWRRMNEVVGPFVRTLNLALALTILFFVMGITWEGINLYGDYSAPLFVLSVTLLTASFAEIAAFWNMNRGQLARVMKEEGLDRAHNRACSWTFLFSFIAVVGTALLPEVVVKGAILLVFLVAYQTVLVVATAFNLNEVAKLRGLMEAMPATESDDSQAPAVNGKPNGKKV